MANLPEHPIIYEINTFVWLNTLSRNCGYPVTLNNVPEETVEELAALGVDAIWLMGVWQRNPAGLASALNYIHEYRPALPDVAEDDVVGSAYAIGAYEVDSRLGGREGLAAFRARLAQRGIKLLLDFVPNHVATDHPWIPEHPDYFVRGTTRDKAKRPDVFFETRDAWGRSMLVAHGRDPYFPAWIDTAQLDAFSRGYRRAAVETLLDIASQADGVRCDMAMLATNRIFHQTWWGDVESQPLTEFWEEIIPQVRARYPEFVFIAEVYWGMEYDLQQQGFNYTYDKLLYDRILEGDARKVRDHLLADADYQRRLLRFIENHDEPRAASAVGVEKSVPAAVLMSTLPGGVLLHDGQLTGRKVKLPVHITRQPDEPEQAGLYAFYARLLNDVRQPIYREGEWCLFEVTATHKDNKVFNNIISYGWRVDGEYRLIAVNLSQHWVQGMIDLRPWSEIAAHDWALRDMLDDTYYFRHGDQIVRNGLFVELRPYSAHVLRLERVQEVLHDETARLGV